MPSCLMNSPYLDREIRSIDHARRDIARTSTIAWNGQLGRFPATGPRVFEATISTMRGGRVMWTVTKPTQYQPLDSGISNSEAAARRAAERVCRRNFP